MGSIITQTITEDGELVGLETEHSFRNDEPAFCKTYVEDLGRIHKLPKGAISVLLELIKRINYQEEIALSLHIKKNMQGVIGFKNIKSVDQAMIKLIESGILIRVARGSFMLDPNLFAKGQWKDIRNLRKKFLELKIIYNDEGRQIKCEVRPTLSASQ
jgi:hypothetical protein